MSFLRIILIGSYVAGLAGLVLGTAIRLGLALGAATPTGALRFAMACFLCALATRAVAEALEAPRDEAKATAAASR